MSGLAQALRLRAAPGRLWATRPRGGGAGARPWGWGLALGLALGVKAPTAAGCEAEGGREAKASPPPPPRAFGAAIERSRDLLRRVKVRSGGTGAGRGPVPGTSAPLRGPGQARGERGSQGRFWGAVAVLLLRVWPSPVGGFHCKEPSPCLLSLSVRTKRESRA